MRPAETPFVIEHRRVMLAGQNFRPEAKLLLTAGLRTSGLLAQLTPDAALPLLTLLSFLTPNGRIAPTLHEIGEARGLSPSGVRDFMEPLTRLVFDDSPIAIPRLRESGMDGYLLSPKIVHNVEEASEEVAPEPLGYIPAGREAIVAASRRKYARPRAEVEREIEIALGHDPAQVEETPEGDARRRLYSLGVPRSEIDPLLAEFGIEEAQKQLDWLPLRGAKSPARFVVAAIRGRYQAPPGAAGIVDDPIVSVTTEAASQGDLPEEPLQGELSREILLDDLPDIRWDLQ